MSGYVLRASYKITSSNDLRQSDIFVSSSRSPITILARLHGLRERDISILGKKVFCDNCMKYFSEAAFRKHRVSCFLQDQMF